jgi:Rhodopirellula transposase DDE domain
MTRGDPTQPPLWTTRSLRNVANESANKGHKVCPTVVGDLLRGMGYSLQAKATGHTDMRPGMNTLACWFRKRSSVIRTHVAGRIMWRRDH